MLCSDRIRSTFLPDILASDLFLSFLDNRFLHLDDLLFLISRAGRRYRCLNISGTVKSTERNRNVVRVNSAALYICINLRKQLTSPLISESGEKIPFAIDHLTFPTCNVSRNKHPFISRLSHYLYKSITYINIVSHKR